MRRTAGIMQPVFAIRTADDLGIGDTDGVGQLIEWCHRHGLHLLQMLPINETGSDGCPYTALSAMAIDPTTIALSPRHVPDLAEEDFQRLAPPDLLAELRAGPVKYAPVKALKRALLEAAFARFSAENPNPASGRAASFHKFMGANADWLFEYALFRALMEENGDSPHWEQWPAEHQSPDRARTWLRALPAARRSQFQRRELFHAYVQWLAFGQWQSLKRRAEELEVHLMGDMPIGLARGSADVWAHRAIFDLDWSAGAPPEPVFQNDPFTKKWGQNWGSPLFRWDELSRRDFDWWRTRVALARKVFHLCRIDHVMGLFRIYAFPWPPERNAEFLPLDHAQAAAKTGGRLPGFRPHPDDTPDQITQNQWHGEEVLHVILDAAAAMTIVAEDLGHVPGYVRETMSHLGIPGFRVPALFRDADGRYANPADYPVLSLTQPSTHDHAPLAAAWAGLWQNIDRGENVSENFRELLWAMDFAGIEGEPPREYTDRLHEAVLRAALKSSSCLAVVMLADVFAETTLFNIPGTIGADNWSARAPYTVAEMEQEQRLIAKTETFSRLVRETGRAKDS